MQKILKDKIQMYNRNQKYNCRYTQFKYPNSNAFFPISGLLRKVGEQEQLLIWQCKMVHCLNAKKKKGPYTYMTQFLTDMRFIITLEVANLTKPLMLFHTCHKGSSFELILQISTLIPTWL